MPVAKPPAPVQPQYLWWAVVCGHKWQQEKKHWWTAKHEGCERERGGGHSNPLCFESSVLCDSKFTSAHHVQWVALAWSQGEQVPGHRYSLSAEVGASEWAQGRKQEQELGQCLSLFLVPSFSRSLSHSQSQTHTPSLPQPTSHSHCVFNPGLFCGRIPHEDSRFCGSLFLPGPAMLFCHPFSFQFAWKCLHVPVCLCVASMPPSSLCERAYAHYAHTHIHIWVKRHTIPSEPGNARDYGKRCDYYQDFYFLLPPSTSFVFDKHSIDPSWPGVLCLLTVKKQAAQTHDYCGYFWKTSMHLIFHLLKNSACWRPPPKTTPSLNSNLCFSHSHTMLFCGMWRPQHTSEVLMLPSVWILKYCPLTHSA